jgi:hypothetical protein
LRHDAGNRVGAAAGRIRHDKLDRALRPFLRSRLKRADEQQQNADRRKMQCSRHSQCKTRKHGFSQCPQLFMLCSISGA